jgi:mono/diheme cytochrome c family protein
MSSCAVSQKVKEKTGTQLWGENCGRCHNAPGPGEFSSANWDIIGRHMRIRAQITEIEEKKIIEYLKNSVQ